MEKSQTYSTTEGGQVVAKRIVSDIDAEEDSSSGHKLGQIVGDWFEEYFALPILNEIAKDLNLFVDSRFAKRSDSVRGDKINWADLDGNQVDYDFVFELNGSEIQRGIPVAFFETFWRRGSRHSKDKARDDSGKLMPMSDTYPTARLLGILSAGDFTGPAKELVKSRGIDLFYIKKDLVLQSWSDSGLNIDYADKASEAVKAVICDNVKDKLNPEIRQAIAKNLRDTLGETEIKSYKDRIKSSLASLPQSYRLIYQKQSIEYKFDDAKKVVAHLSNQFNEIAWDGNLYLSYQIEFSDGREFERDYLTIENALSLHNQMNDLVEHMKKVYK